MMSKSSLQKASKFGAFTLQSHVVTNSNQADKQIEQVHGGTVVAAGSLPGRPVADGIAITTDDNSGSVGITTADCLPLALVGEHNAVILHVSRKSILKNLIENALTYVKPADITHVYIGPHICQDHFIFEHMGEELQKFCRRFPNACRRGQTIHLSLRQAVQHYLDDWGITADQIIQDDRCTFEDQTLPSYRRGIDPVTNYIVTRLARLN